MIRKIGIFVMFILLFGIFRTEHVSAEVGFDFQNLNQGTDVMLRGLCHRANTCVSGSKTYTINWFGMESGDQPISLTMQEEFNDDTSIEIGKITNLTKDIKSITIDNLVVQDAFNFNADGGNLYHKVYDFKIDKETPDALEYRVIQNQNIINIVRIKNQTIKFSVVRDGPINGVRSLPFVLTKNGEQSKSHRTTFYTRSSSQHYSFITTKYDDKNRPYTFDIITDGDDRVKIEKKVINENEFEFRIRQDITKEIPLKGHNTSGLTGEVVFITDNQKELTGIVKDGNVVFENIRHEDLNTFTRMKRYNLNDASVELNIREDRLKEISEIAVERFIDKTFNVEWGPNILAYPGAKETDTIDIHLFEGNQATEFKKTVAFNQSEVTFKVNPRKETTFSVDDGFVSVANDLKIYIDRVIQPLQIDIQKAYKPKRDDDLDIQVEILSPPRATGKIDLNELLGVDGFIIHETPKPSIEPDREVMLSVDGFVIHDTLDEPKNRLRPDPVFLDGYGIEDVQNHEYISGMEAIMQKERMKQKYLEDVLEQDRKNRIAYELSTKEYEAHLNPIILENHFDGFPIELQETALHENLNPIIEVGVFNDNQQIFSMVDVEGEPIKGDILPPYLEGEEVPEHAFDHTERDAASKFLSIIETKKRVELERILLQDIENRKQHERETNNILDALLRRQPDSPNVIEPLEYYEIIMSNPIIQQKEGVSKITTEQQSSNLVRDKSIKTTHTPKEKTEESHAIKSHYSTIKQKFDEKTIARVINKDTDGVLPKTGKQKHSNKWGIILILMGVCVLLPKRHKNRIVN
ncbi:hypothetical protein [Erysipelothrix sp. P66]|uniref:hypothetical protein n=1 Tax=Erysipelothrix sp. P66 TaxID=3141531 RepID=UPI00315D3FAF